MTEAGLVHWLRVFRYDKAWWKAHHGKQPIGSIANYCGVPVDELFKAIADGRVPERIAVKTGETVAAIVSGTHRFRKLSDATWIFERVPHESVLGPEGKKKSNKGRLGRPTGSGKPRAAHGAPPVSASARTGTRAG